MTDLLRDDIEVFGSLARTDTMAAIAYALLQQAAAQREIAAAIRALGNADASTPMGAIEALGEVLGRNLGDLADAVRERDA